jgi:hypothetical protein
LPTWRAVSLSGRWPMLFMISKKHLPGQWRRPGVGAVGDGAVECRSNGEREAQGHLLDYSIAQPGNPLVRGSVLRQLARSWLIGNSGA